MPATRSARLTEDLALPVAFLALDLTLPSGERLHYVLDVIHTRSFILGRASEILVQDPMVSQRHALICFDPARGWEVLDLRSTNGTFLNGRPLEGLTPLAGGDLISLGQSSARVTHLAAASGPAQPQVSGMEPPSTLRMRAPDRSTAAQAPPTPQGEFKAELEQLRIEIDQVRKEREVREILESDFFRQVQERAAELRRSETQ